MKAPRKLPPRSGRAVGAQPASAMALAALLATTAPAFNPASWAAAPLQMQSDYKSPAIARPLSQPPATLVADLTEAPDLLDLAALNPEVAKLKAEYERASAAAAKIEAEVARLHPPINGRKACSFFFGPQKSCRFPADTCSNGHHTQS